MVRNHIKKNDNFQFKMLKSFYRKGDIIWIRKKTELDFPFYNDPTIRTIDILILLAAPILFSIYTFTPFSIPFGMGPYVFTLVHLVAFLYVARGKISLLIKNPRKEHYQLL